MQRGLIRRGRTQMLLPRVITYHSHGLQLRAASPFQSTKGDEVAFGENGTYNGYRFTERAVDVIERHDSQEPLFLYLALHNTHGPIQAPDRFVELYDFEQQKRNHFNAMVSVVDSTVANVTAALHRRGLYDNTLIVWTTDNGAPVQVAGSNAPFRGSKGSNWEGGVHVRLFPFFSRARLAGYSKFRQNPRKFAKFR